MSIFPSIFSYNLPRRAYSLLKGVATPIKKLKSIIISIAISLGTGILSALLTMGNMDIYSSVKTPALSPPSLLFPMVWTVLFILMGISSALVFNTPNATPGQKKQALTTYAASLFFNFTWSIIFFNFQSFTFAFVWLVILWLLILKTIREYLQINPPAAYLQIPYALWVAFAGYLNVGIVLLNR